MWLVLSSSQYPDDFSSFGLLGSEEQWLLWLLWKWELWQEVCGRRLYWLLCQITKNKYTKKNVINTKTNPIIEAMTFLITIKSIHSVITVISWLNVWLMNREKFNYMHMSSASERSWLSWSEIVHIFFPQLFFCFALFQMFTSIIFAAVGVVGAGYSVIVSAVAINRGPKCMTNENVTHPIYAYPFNEG